jgi:NAD(P)-dependent dehydrogenase (short-subunit alcohol dehydrogenase family)
VIRSDRGELANATAVVTGAGQGIGAAIAMGLAAAGARVVLSGRRAETLEEVCDAIRERGGVAQGCAGDVTKPDDVAKLMATAAGERGRFEILVNNAGIAGPTAPLIDISLEARHGKIVNIGSVTGKQPLVNRSPYAAAKLGVVGLTRTLAHELGPDGISVNVVSPWLVEGERLADVIDSMARERGVTPDALRAEMTAGTVFKRTVAEADVVATTLFLCSTGANSITGQDINVSGGAVMY